MDLSFLSYAFIDRAYLAGIFVAIACSALGVFLVLKKMSLVGDGLAHVSFGAIALGLFLGFAPFYVAVPICLLGALLIWKISERAGLFADTAIAIVSAFGVAAGVILASLAHGFNVDLMSYLFGSILAISPSETALSIALSIVIIVFVAVFYRQLFAMTFDEEFAKTSGVKTGWLNAAVVMLTGLTVVISVRVVGTLLVSAFIVLPVVSAFGFSKSFKQTIILAPILSVIAVVAGITYAYFADLPAGATIVMVNFFLLALSAGKRLFK
jgi:zinc transport system permease protein